MTAVPPFLLRLMVPTGSGTLRLGPEDRIAREFADRLRAWSLEGRMTALWFHVPNELAGRHNDRRAAIRYGVAKALGLIPGVADYVFLSGTGAWVLEAKAPRGSLTATQKDFRAWCALHGVPHAVMRSADDGERALREWGVLRSK